jgi:death-on-curing protein
MAAAYLFHITQNHPFLDGNKRAGAKAALVFLEVNDWTFVASEDELVEIALGVASSALNKQKLTETFEQRCRPSS